MIWLCQTLQQLGLRPAIVSRGYGGQGDALNDEGREIRLRLPDVPVIQNRQRAEGAQVAIDQHGANVIVLDDGFQHRRLHRDLDLVLIDATCPWGYGYVLPRGLLREPIEGLRRADAVILTRRNLVSDQVVVDVRQFAQNYSPMSHGSKANMHRPAC